MAKKSKKKIASKARISAPAKVFKKTPARNSPVAKPTIAARKEITHEMVAKRAYEIFLGGRGGDEMHNWLLAERELKGL